MLHLSSNRDLDFDTSLNIDDDLLDDLSRGVKINQTLVDSHLESIPSLRSFTTRSLSGGDFESLGWETDGTLDTEILGLGTLDELLADLLEGLNLSAGQGNSNLVGFWTIAEFLVGVLLVRHFVCCSSFTTRNSKVLRQSDEGDR